MTQGRALRQQELEAELFSSNPPGNAGRAARLIDPDEGPSDAYCCLAPTPQSHKVPSRASPSIIPTTQPSPSWLNAISVRNRREMVQARSAVHPDPRRPGCARRSRFAATNPETSIRSWLSSPLRRRRASTCVGRASRLLLRPHRAGGSTPRRLSGCAIPATAPPDLLLREVVEGRDEGHVELLSTLDSLMATERPIIAGARVANLVIHEIRVSEPGSHGRPGSASSWWRVVLWWAAPARTRVASSNGRPCRWRPTGRPPARPQGSTGSPWVASPYSVRMPPSLHCAGLSRRTSGRRCLENSLKSRRLAGAPSAAGVCRA